jgi:hypothetical protein
MCGVKAKIIKSANQRLGYVFAITVNGADSRRGAELAVLSAFAKRQPDGCSFHLNRKDSQKDAYIAGSMSGVQLGFELAMRSIEKQMAHMKLKRGFSRNGS